jgi:hypothetical protein
MGKAGEHPFQDLVVRAFEREPAAPLVRDGEDAVDIGKILAPAAIAKTVGDIARGARN